MAATPSQKQTLEAILAELQTQGAAIAANTAAVLALAGDLERSKNFSRWTAEYLAGTNTELADIEAGTHTF